MRYRLKSLLAFVMVFSVLCFGINRCRWYGGGYAESIASHLRSLPKVSSVQLQGFSDGPGDYSILDLTIKLEGGNDRIVVIDCPADGPNEQFQIIRIGPYNLYTMPDSGLWAAPPDFGRKGSFSRVLSIPIESITDIIDNYDLILDEIGRWPREARKSSIAMPDGKKISYWASPNLASKGKPTP